MPLAEIPQDTSLAARLIAGQFPHWAALPLAEVPRSDADIVLYRLGPDLALRLPRHGAAAARLLREAQFLPRFGPLPLLYPRPLALGAPAPGFPHPFTIVPWLPGAPVPVAELPDPPAAAQALGWCLRALRQLPVAGAPLAGRGNALRGAGLARIDADTRAALARADGLVNQPAALALWQDALDAPAHAGPPVWLHGNLHPGALLSRDGRLTALLDWDFSATGDPAVDLAAAWTCLPARARDAFRTAAGAPGPAWQRAAGWALHLAVTGLLPAPDPSGAETARARAVLAALGLNPG